MSARWDVNRASPVGGADAAVSAWEAGERSEAAGREFLEEEEEGKLHGGR